MNSTPKTIQIFLPSGDPRGIRIAEITTRIVQVIDVPRSRIDDFLKMPEGQQVALYFLIGSQEGDENLEVYIGQTGDLRSRLINHNRSKDFWERALIVISRTNSLTQTHAMFLEWHCIQAVRETGRYSDHNVTSGTRPHTPAPLEADCIEIFDTASTLVATLGHPLFVPLTSESSEETEMLFCRGSEADGRGIYTQEGFVVFKGSSGRIENVPSMKRWSLDKAREKLLELGVLSEEGGRLVFVKDHLFSSPSAAAIAVMGRNANGWIEWKNEDGQTLDELKRQSIEA